MDVDLLYFDGCPNWRETLDELREVMRGLGLKDEVRLVKVASNEEAAQVRFPGSPTVRVNGRDVEPEEPPTEFRLDCRIYWVDGWATGKPKREWLVDALS